MSKPFIASWSACDSGVHRLKPGEYIDVGTALLHRQAVHRELRKLPLVCIEPEPDEFDLLGYLSVIPAKEGQGFASLTMLALRVEAVDGSLRLLVGLAQSGKDWRASLWAINGTPEAMHANLARSQVGPLAHWDT